MEEEVTRETHPMLKEQIILVFVVTSNVSYRNDDKDLLWYKYLIPFIILKVAVEISSSNYLSQMEVFKNVLDNPVG